MSFIALDILVSNIHLTFVTVFTSIVLLLLFWDSIVDPILMSIFYSSSSSTLNHKTVLITGAARRKGIGYALASSFLNQGCHVILWDIDEKALLLAKQTLSLESGTPTTKTTTATTATPSLSRLQRITTQVVDVSNSKAVHIAATQLQKQQKRTIHILVNNAGIVNGKSMLHLNSKDVQKTYNVNVLSQYFSISEFLPKMIQNKKGLIITISSMMGMMGGANLADYCGSKWALLGLDESLRMELRRNGTNAKGIRTLVVCPYMVNTGMFRGAFGEKNGKNKEHTNRSTSMLRGGMNRLRDVLIPKLSPETVANNVVVAAGRLMLPNGTCCSCNARGKIMILPSRLSLVPSLLRLLPIGLQEIILDLGGGTMGMNDFQGHTDVKKD